MMQATDVRILIGVDEWLAEMMKMFLERAGFRNLQLRPDVDREFFAKQHRAFYETPRPYYQRHQNIGGTAAFGSARRQCD